MAARSTADEMRQVQLSDEDTEELWNSPSKRGSRRPFHAHSPSSPPPSGPRPQKAEDTLFDRHEAREAALQHELRTVRNINEVIEGLLESIDKAKGNMEVCRPWLLALAPDLGG